MAQQHLNLRLDEAVDLPGCPICRIVLQRVAHSMDSINYEFVNDPGWRADALRAWGFCNMHAEQWLEFAHPLGTALIYEGVLGRIAEQMQQARPSNGGFVERLRTSLSIGNIHGAGSLVERGSCPFCVVRENEAALAVGQLLDELGVPAFRERYAASDGLCVTHLNAALGQAPGETALAALSARITESHREIRAQLQEIIRKHDYRYRNELLGEERGSVERAVRQVAGQPGIGDRRCHPATAN